MNSNLGNPRGLSMLGYCSATKVGVQALACSEALRTLDSGLWTVDFSLATTDPDLELRCFRPVPAGAACVPAITEQSSSRFVDYHIITFWFVCFSCLVGLAVMLKRIRSGVVGWLVLYGSS